MKFYLAGRYEDLPLLRDVAFLLIQSGHVVTSRWLCGETPAPTLPGELQAVAEQDLEDIRAADCFVLYSHTTLPLPTRQGHSVELGYALGLNSANGNYGLPNVAVVMVGERTANVFHYHGAVQHYPTWRDFFQSYTIAGQLLNGG
jgi:hypothetical protein